MKQDFSQRAAIFVDDGAPDAFEFSNNYIWFDPDDPADQRRAWHEALRLWSVRRSRFSRDGNCDLRRPELCSGGG
jgi:hypothetical protein